MDALQIEVFVILYLCQEMIETCIIVFQVHINENAHICQVRIEKSRFSHFFESEYMLAYAVILRPFDKLSITLKIINQ